MKKVRLAAIGVPALGIMAMPAVAAHAATTPTPGTHGTLTPGKKAGIPQRVVCLQTSSRSNQTYLGTLRGSIGFTGSCVARVSARLDYVRRGLTERVRFWTKDGKMVAERFTGGVINTSAIYYLSYPDIYANGQVCEAIVPNSNHNVVKWGPVRIIHAVEPLCVIYHRDGRAGMKDGLFLEMIGLPHTNQKNQAIAMYHTTGFTRDEIVDLCVLVSSVSRSPDSAKWPPILGLFKSVVATLAYMRHNRTQSEIGESFGVSQPTVSRAISAVTPLIPEAVREFVPVADDLDPGAQYILDGTLLPCWSWAGRTELYSGKHKTTGMNVQVACTIYGKLAWISDPVNGSRHDNYCQEESGVLLTMDPKNWIGDKGYIGNNMITPYRKPAGGELLAWQKEYNSQVNKIRWMIEQVISHFKNWTIVHTDYRRPLDTFTTTISAVVGLHFYRTA